jgi:molybdopterin converting factor small subunit
LMVFILLGLGGSFDTHPSNLSLNILFQLTNFGDWQCIAFCFVIDSPPIFIYNVCYMRCVNASPRINSFKSLISLRKYIMAKIQYMGQIRAIVGRRDEMIDHSQETTVLAILHQLAKRYGLEFEAEVLDDAKQGLREGILITVNGIATGQLDGVTTKVGTHDTLTILPLFTGGG